MKQCLGLIILLALSSCKKDDDNPKLPDPVLNDGEVITTCILQFQDAALIWPSVEATFRDPDGEGGNPPSQLDTIRLHANAIYHANILLLNETVSPADSISNEVLAEASEHLFCFDTEGAALSIVRTDTDGVYELGIATDWSTGMASAGSVTITLKHQPGIKDGTCSPGETDVEITFPVIIE